MMHIDQRISTNWRAPLGGPTCVFAALLLWCSSPSAAQPELPFKLEQLSIGLPEEGAPRAVVGPYAVTTETIAGTHPLQVYRPADLARFPAHDTLPIVI